MNPWDAQNERVYSADGVWHSLNANNSGGQSRDAVLTTVAAIHQNQCGEVRMGAAANTISTNSNASGRNEPIVFDARGNGDGKTVCTLTGDHQSRVSDYTATVMATGQVRRLTPLECERLQGYPDGWTDIGPWTDSAGKLHKESSDSARYKALGNSIALPPWSWVLKRLCACYERTATMTSLFDGIGGFPLIWERLNGPGSCLWASEIEEFQIAVTRRRFGGKEG